MPFTKEKYPFTHLRWLRGHPHLGSMRLFSGRNAVTRLFLQESEVSRRRARPAFALALLALCLAASSAGAVQSGAPPAAADPAFAFLDLLERAEARSAARDWAAAIPLWEEVVRANPTDGRFWGRLGTARFNLHDYRGAIPALQRSVELGFGQAQNQAYNVACAYAQLGDKDQAFAWLERALAMRFLNLELALTDPDLAPLRSDPRFQRLIPLAVDTSGMSRAQGWRHDLDVLQWQIDRLGRAPYRLHPRSWFQQQFAELAVSTGRRTDLQMAIEVMRIMRELGDGHSGLQHGATADWALSLPLQFQAFPEGVFITAASPEHRDLLGAQLTEFGGRPIEEVMRWVEQGVSVDNESGNARLNAAFRLRYTALLQAGGAIAERDGAALRLRGLDGAERTVRVAADMSQPDIWNQKPAPPGWVTLSQVLPGPDPLYLRDPARNYWFEHLPARRTVYFAFNTIRDQPDESIAAFSRRLETFIAANQVDRLVIDLRWNNGGNAQLLTPLIAALLRSERINRRGRLVVLIGPRTFSAAQSAATMIERYSNAMFVGEPTGSSPNFVGEEDAFTLPYSRLSVNVSHLEHQNSIPQDRRTWIAPLLLIPVTFADYRAKRDPALDAVLRIPIPE
jgi:tetratricopeptide (TPR) repeat protein